MAKGDRAGVQRVPVWLEEGEEPAGSGSLPQLSPGTWAFNKVPLGKEREMGHLGGSVG